MLRRSKRMRRLRRRLAALYDCELSATLEAEALYRGEIYRPLQFFGPICLISNLARACWSLNAHVCKQASFWLA